MFSGAQDVMVAMNTHGCVCSHTSRAHSQVFGPTDRPLPSHAHYFKITQAHVNTVAAVAPVSAVFRLGWQMEVHPNAAAIFTQMLCSVQL